jgi:hypothetical protein
MPGAVVGFVVLLSALAMPSAAASKVPHVPTVGVTPPVTELGATVRANLNYWHVPLVFVSICGDGAHRGSQDCDQVSSISVELSRSGEGSGLMIVQPPIACPCVIRATTPDNAIVATAPIYVRGLRVMKRSEMYPDLDAPSKAVAATATSAAASTDGSFGGMHPLTWVLVLAGVLGGCLLALLAARRRRAPVGPPPAGPNPTTGRGPVPPRPNPPPPAAAPGPGAVPDSVTRRVLVGAGVVSQPALPFEPTRRPYADLQASLPFDEAPLPALTQWPPDDEVVDLRSVNLTPPQGDESANSLLDDLYALFAEDTVSSSLA